METKLTDNERADKAQAQLATVTAERDALRELLEPAEEAAFILRNECDGEDDAIVAGKLDAVLTKLEQLGIAVDFCPNNKPTTKGK